MRSRVQESTSAEKLVAQPRTGGGVVHHHPCAREAARPLQHRCHEVAGPLAGRSLIGLEPAEQMQLRTGHGGMDAGRPQPEQLVEPADRVRREQRARSRSRRKLGRVGETGGRCERDDDGGGPPEVARDAVALIVAGRHQNGAKPRETDPPANPAQPVGAVVEPENPTPAIRCLAEKRPTAVGDDHVHARRDRRAERLPFEPPVVRRFAAERPHMDAMSARGERAGQPGEGGFGSAKRSRVDRVRPEREAPVEHEDGGHRLTPQ
jgi:hypothetical protein